jgi:hypothetical protein
MNLDREPALRELLVDPLLHVLMARDGVDYRKLLDLIDDARVRLGLPAIADADTLTCLVETAPVSATERVATVPAPSHG